MAVRILFNLKVRQVSLNSPDCNLEATEETSELEWLCYLNFANTSYDSVLGNLQRSLDFRKKGLIRDLGSSMRFVTKAWVLVFDNLDVELISDIFDIS